MVYGGQERLRLPGATDPPHTGLKPPIPTMVACWCLGLSALAFTYFSLKTFTVKDFKHTKARERGKMNISLSATQMNKTDVTHAGEVS